MSEIFNLRTLCRCCHKDGNFRSLQLAYVYEERVEVYSVMLQETFNINIDPPPFEASFTICDQCIQILRDASYFKKQVLMCEQKFEEYCKNELALIKEEVIDDSYNNKNSWSVSEFDNNDIQEEKYEQKPKMESDFKVDVKDTFGTFETQLVAIEFDRNENTSNVDKPNKLKRDILKGKLKKKKTLSHKLDPELEICVQTKNKTRIICKICGKGSTKLVSIRRHIATDHPETVTCVICSRVFAHRKRYHEHALTHLPGYLTCRICTKRFSKHSALISHMTRHMITDRYQCDVCGKVFTSRTVVRRHLLWHQGRNKTCVCEICGRGFNDRTNMQIHVRVKHLKLRPFICRVCNKTFTANKHLKEHNIRCHVKESPHQCGTCGKLFGTAFQLKQHTLRHEALKDQRVKTCKVCKATFDTRGKLMSHLKHHVGQKHHKCHLCSKDFVSKYTLNRHVFAHTGVRAHECALCDAKFKHPTSLKRHEHRFHDPERIVNEKVKCDVCSKYYRDFDKHMSTHDKRPHACDWCEKSYPVRNALNRHVNHVHFDRKRFQCALCDKKYTQFRGLKYHSMKVHSRELKKEEHDV